jgi:nitric oxide reductase NorD protein
MNLKELIHILEAADPQLAEDLAKHAGKDPGEVFSPLLKDCLEDILWGLAQEISFGRAMALGYVALVDRCGDKEILAYQSQIRRFGQIGPELGKLMAEHLVPVLMLRHVPLFNRFLEVMGIMLSKGVYTLYGPLKTLDRICEEKDIASVFAYLELLGGTFSLNLTYKQARPFTYTLPKAVLSFSTSRREFQIRQLDRVIQRDFELSDYFLEGLSKGLHLLSSKALAEFVEKGLGKYARNKKSCAKFLSLESKSGLDIFSELQVVVPLSQVRQQVSQYIKARTGLSVSVKALSQVPGRFLKGSAMKPLASSDGKTIYLPDEIDLFPHRNKNLEVYKCLAKLEIGFFEFGSFDFDLEKLQTRTDFPTEMNTAHSFSDFEAFIRGFDSPPLASDLFTLFEHARLMDLSREYYPGLVRKILPLLREEWNTRSPEKIHGNPLSLLYQDMVLNIPGQTRLISDPFEGIVNSILRTYREEIQMDSGVETSAELVCRFYKDVKHLLKTHSETGLPLFTVPFHRKIQADFLFSGLQSMDEIALLLKNRLEKLGIHTFRSDIRKKLAENNGALSPADIKSMVLKRRDADPRKSGINENNATGNSVDFSSLDISRILEESGFTPAPAPEITGPAFYYKEWDHRLGDYLHNHTLVHEKAVPLKDNGFYENTLSRYQGLISRIKYAFEMLKPEEITLLRQWVEGDEFDYRALLDFTLDKKAGIMPSDRLYIKRIKQRRDVAVLLLVDLSRSTSNFVVDSPETVLDVEKQAIVLFSEALDVVGDHYAIAGFSGNGRLGVDYFKIKEFDETLNQGVRRRINAMAPQRSTRMGAAIRHATAQLEKSPSLVRLIIIMGDGFPNDVDYKKDHAVSDTRKAILEARSKNIYTHALTVNIAEDSNLDDLYGKVHHHIISDVRELPDKLPRIYSTLTRQ